MLTWILKLETLYGNSFCPDTFGITWKPCHCNGCCLVCLDQPHDMFGAQLTLRWLQLQRGFFLSYATSEARKGKTTWQINRAFLRKILAHILALCYGELFGNSETVVLKISGYIRSHLLYLACPPFLCLLPPVRSRHLQQNKIWD